MKHLNLPLAEKMARIEKLDTQTIRSDASDDEGTDEIQFDATFTSEALFIISRNGKSTAYQINQQTI
jgi:hypothetical protein